MSSPIEDLQKRIQDLEDEKLGPFQFFIKYILSPLLVVIVGFVLSWKIENGRKEIQKIQVAHSMLPSLFSEDHNINVTLATQRLWEKVLDDDNLKEAIDSILKDYMQFRLNESVEEQNYEKIEELYDAASTFKGRAGRRIMSSIDSNREVSSKIYGRRKARIFIRRGFDELINEDFHQALTYFKTASEMAPHYRSTNAIYKLLESNKNRLGDSAVKKKIYREIVEKHSARMPHETVLALEQKLK